MIKFLDLMKINDRHAQEIGDALINVASSGWYLQGQANDSFQEQLAWYLGVRNVIPCGNGLDALRLVLRAWIELGILKAGDEVIVPANTYIATILAITDNGLHPVFVEPDPLTANIDISRIEAAITPYTRVLLPVHLYGRIAWSEELPQLAAKYNLKILEDNAQSIGAYLPDGRCAGTLGDAAACSFYPGKNLGAMGDAGAILTNDDQLARTLHALTNYGSEQKYHNDFQGLNSRMDEMQAAVLCVKLRFLTKDNERRREIAQRYDREITNPLIQKLTPATGGEHVHHLYVIRTSERNRLQQYLTEHGVQTLIHYPIPPHKQACYPQFANLSLPITEQLALESLSIPISPVMNEEEVEDVIDLINHFK